MGPALSKAFLTRPIAHRALHGPGAPENSRAAVAAAVAAGYGIEIDLQLSADGVAMVFHDGALDRLTGERGPVRARSAADLGAIALKGSTEGVPSFAEVLDLVAGRVPLLVEIKDQTGEMGETDGRLEAAAVRDAAGYEGPLALMSFSPSAVCAVAGLAPDRPRGLVTSAFPAESWPGLPEARRVALARIDADAVGASFISHEWTDLASPRVAELAQTGRAILCWTITSAEQEAQARGIAHNITFERYLPRVLP